MTKKNKAHIHVTGKIKKRMLFTVGIIVCGFCLLVIKLAQISIIEHDRYSKLAINQQLRDTTINAPRGKIYDANMNVLATSATAWEVALSPMDIKTDDYETIANGLSEILDVDYQKILDKCSEKSYYSIVKRKVDQPVVDEIRQFMLDKNIKGITFREDPKRYYPYGNFAAQVLGFVGVDNQGLSGVESYYDSYLSGTPGRMVTAKNAVGSEMYYEYKSLNDAQEGYSLVLTIDEVIQHYLEKHLEEAVREHNVLKRGSGIVMNVKTGEILAMATKGDFDPNNPLEIFDEEERERINAIEDPGERAAALLEAQNLQWRNKAISDLYEPGSVFKIVTASTALETGAVTLDSQFSCSGSVRVGVHTMHCARRQGHGSMDFTHAVVNSCNPAFISIGASIGPENFYKYFASFGLTLRTGIDLPGEADPIYVSRDGMGVVELASCSFGQSNSITPIQMVTAVAAAVNGGYLVQPHVVSQIIDSDGNLVTTQIGAISEKQLKQLIERVLSDN